MTNDKITPPIMKLPERQLPSSRVGGEGLAHGGTIGNSGDMTRLQNILSNGVTKAHDEACMAVDKIVEDAHALVERLEKAAEAHKARLKQEGQKIAVELESAVQQLTRTVEWVENQAPNLRNPKLVSPIT